MTISHMLNNETRTPFMSAAKGRALLSMVLLLCCLTGLKFEAAAQKKKRNTSRPKAEHQGGHTHTHAEAAKTNNQQDVLFSMLDMEVLDQNGHRRKFYTDLVKGKVVVINFIYTSCKAVCPMSGSNFAKLQSLLGERLGREVHLISVTTDPLTDTSLMLKDWGGRFQAKAGWTMVTGQQKAMNDLLLALTGDGPRTGYHVPAICILNDKLDVQLWTYGLSAPQALLKMVDEVTKPQAAQAKTRAD